MNTCVSKTDWRKETALLLLALLTGACTGKIEIGTRGADVGNGSVSRPGSGGGANEPEQDQPLPFEPAPPVMARLTQAQYDNVIRDLFGTPLEKHGLEPDTRPSLFSVIGAAMTSNSEFGVASYVTEAYAISAAVFADVAKRQALSPCSATAPLTDACLTTFINDFGRRAWRRPIDAASLESYRALGTAVGLSDPVMALQYVTAALLASPNFLYRVELGEPDSNHPGWLHYTGYEMASRLSFLLRNSAPDAELMAAAESGSLLTVDGILEQANRLLGETEPTREFVNQFFREYLDLVKVSALTFPVEIDADRTLADSERSEVLSLVNRVALDEGSDYRGIFTTHETVIDQNLASLYGLPAPNGAGFQSVELPADGPRAGLLGTAALLSLNNRVNRTSPTLRGLFVFNRVLCGEVAPPPNDVPPFPETDFKEGQSVRQILEQHRTNPACAGCHAMMDPIGVGMEDFDRYGRYRKVDDHGNAVDDAGDLGETPFRGTRELGELLAKDPRVSSCLVKQVFRYASARLETEAEEIVLNQLDQAFQDGGFVLKPLLLALVVSDGFRYLNPEAP